MGGYHLGGAGGFLWSVRIRRLNPHSTRCLRVKSANPSNLFARSRKSADPATYERRSRRTCRTRRTNSTPNSPGRNVRLCDPSSSLIRPCAACPGAVKPSVLTLVPLFVSSLTEIHVPGDLRTSLLRRLSKVPIVLERSATPETCTTRRVRRLTSRRPTWKTPSW